MSAFKSDFMRTVPQTYNGVGAGRNSTPDDLNISAGQRNESLIPLPPAAGVDGIDRFVNAGAPAWGMQADRPQRSVARACNAPGRLAVKGGSKASHLYIFAAPQLDYDRHDVAAQG